MYEKLILPLYPRAKKSAHITAKSLSRPLIVNGQLLIVVNDW